MADFIRFRNAVKVQLDKMGKLGALFVVDLDKDALWDTYLNSFPPGTDELFLERTEHDCHCCKQFVQTMGGVVAVIENKLASIWDIWDVDDVCYQVVAKAMADLVKSKKVKSVFLHDIQKVGFQQNRRMITDGSTVQFDHFYCYLPAEFVKHGPDRGSCRSKAESSVAVFNRSLLEITDEAVEIVLELIDQKSLYRGQEHRSLVNEFSQCKKEFNLLTTEREKDCYCWSIIKRPTVARIRNTVIGTLLVDISEGKPLDMAVNAFENKVAPTNYKRPTALVTKRMVENAQAEVEELGITQSLQRRHAVASDVTINNVLFADRSSKSIMTAFDEIVNEISVDKKILDKVEEVSISTFIEEILPKTDAVELLFENRQVNNLMSLIAPLYSEAPPILKWGNNFSWIYSGNVTDSIKERVKKAGGSVSGVLRCSLGWFNKDDLDIHILEPGGRHIYFGSKNSSSSGHLDVDMNANDYEVVTDAVENVIWTNERKIKEGVYTVYINNYNQRSTKDVGFEVEIETAGIVHTFCYNKRVVGDVTVAKFEFTHESGIKFIDSLPSVQMTKEVWGISTNNFHKVSLMMYSPNYWDTRSIGNKHYFFILENCKNAEKSRGFFNEFLKEELNPHRKVFEILGSKMKVEESEEQLSGLGFSSTQKNHFFCRVTGSFTRTIKVNL